MEKEKNISLNELKISILVSQAMIEAYRKSLIKLEDRDQTGINDLTKYLEEKRTLRDLLREEEIKLQDKKGDLREIFLSTLPINPIKNEIKSEMSELYGHLGDCHRKLQSILDDEEAKFQEMLKS